LQRATKACAHLSGLSGPQRPPKMLWCAFGLHNLSTQRLRHLTTHTYITPPQKNTATYAMALTLPLTNTQAVGYLDRCAQASFEAYQFVDANGLAGCDGWGGVLAKGCCAQPGGCTLDSCCSFGVSRYVCVHGDGRGPVCVCVCVWCVGWCPGVGCD